MIAVRVVNVMMVATVALLLGGLDSASSAPLDLEG